MNRFSLQLLIILFHLFSFKFLPWNSFLLVQIKLQVYKPKSHHTTNNICVWLIPTIITDISCLIVKCKLNNAFGAFNKPYWHEIWGVMNYFTLKIKLSKISNQNIIWKNSAYNLKSLTLKKEVLVEMLLDLNPFCSKILTKVSEIWFPIPWKRR